MPLKLVPPRPGKTPNYYVRGSYLGVAVDRTTGTPDRTAARKALAKIKSDIEQAWKDEKSAARYQHVVVTEEMTRADLLPTPKRGKSVERG